MGGKQLGGPLAAVVIVVVVILVIGLGYLYVNKDSLGKAGEPRKFGAPGVVPPGADLKMGPFPSDTLPNGQKRPGGGPVSGTGTSPAADAGGR